MAGLTAGRGYSSKSWVGTVQEPIFTRRKSVVGTLKQRVRFSNIRSHVRVKANTVVHVRECCGLKQFWPGWGLTNLIRWPNNLTRITRIPCVSKSLEEQQQSVAPSVPSDVKEGAVNSDVRGRKTRRRRKSVSSSSVTATEGGGSEHLEGLARKHRRRKSKVDREFDESIQTVEDFFRELDRRIETESANYGSRKKIRDVTTTSEENEAANLKGRGEKLSRDAEFGSVASQANSEAHASRFSSKSGYDSVQVEGPREILGSAAQTTDEVGDSIPEEDATKSSADVGQKTSRKKRLGRRERSVLRKAGGVRTTVSQDQTKVERVSFSLSEGRLTAGEEGKNAVSDAGHDKLLPKEYGLQDSTFSIESITGAKATIHRLEKFPNFDGTHDQENLVTGSVSQKVHNRKLGDDEFRPVVAEKMDPGYERVSDEVSDETFSSVRKSGTKRRRQRKKKAQLEQEGGQLGLLHKDKDVDEILAFSEGREHVTWCKVRFEVQAKLEGSQRLFVVGGNPELGAWDLSLALPLVKSQHDDRKNVWESSIKVPRPTVLEYKYFVGGAEDESLDREFGPDLRYLIDNKEGLEDSVQVIKDSWIPESEVRPNSLSWDSSWVKQIDLSSHATEVDVNINDINDVSSHQNGLRVDEPGSSVKSKEELKDFEVVSAVAIEAEKPVHEPDKTKGIDDWLRRRIKKKALPREEPWLIESMVVAQQFEVRKIAEVEEGKSVQIDEVKELPPVQVEILINSPSCTMQRIAIVEDGKLVELLLEPVSTGIQVGNVYLGVVRQLLPGMSGMFVEIGGVQLALLDVAGNQNPYTFPKVNGYNLEPSFDSNSVLDDDSPEDDYSSFEDDGIIADDDDDGGDDSGVHEEELKGTALDITDGESIDKRATQENHIGESTAPKGKSDSQNTGPRTVNFGRSFKKWGNLEEGMQIIVQVKKEALGKKGPRLTAGYCSSGRTIGVSRRVTGPERKRLRTLALELRPPNFGLTVRSEAQGLDREELERDLFRLMETWENILELADSSVRATQQNSEGPVPVLLHRAMGQTLTIVRDFFTAKVHKMVIDSPQCYQEVTSYLQEVAPSLCDRVELYSGTEPLFDAYCLEAQIDKFQSKRVNLPNGGYLILEETEALVSIDVNGGTGMLAKDISQEEAILEVNLAAARQIAEELRLRDIGGLIVIDFIDMVDQSHHKLVSEEMRKSIQRDRSTLNLSEISEFGLMEMTRKRVRPSVTLTITEPCSHCYGVGRVEAHETTLSKIERALRRSLAARPFQADPGDSSRWPQYILKVDAAMGEYLKARKRKRITQLSAALKVWLTLKVVVDFSCSYFQVVEQRGVSERRGNGGGQTKHNEQNSPASSQTALLNKKMWSWKRRRSFATHVFNSG